MDRIARLLSLSTRASRILEVGPSYNPVAPKSAGWNTHVVDHASREEIQAKYATADVDTTLIEDVDTIWQGGCLHDSVPIALHGSFDTLIASHFIEHTPDLVGFLISASHLLRPNGVIALAIPDRRFCFDYFRSPSLTGDLLEAHAAGRTRHSRRTAWNHMAYSATMDGALGWKPGPTGVPRLMDPFASAAATNAAFRDDAEAPYADYHAWQFSPSGFALAVLELGALGMIDWQIDRLHTPEAFEFFAFLRRGATIFTSNEAMQAARLSLLNAQLMETREQIEFALAGGGLVSATGRQALSSGPARDATDQRLTEIAALLREQNGQLREIGITAAWVRTLLRPARALWRLPGRIARRQR